MRICCAYIAVCGGSKTTEFVTRFASTWHNNPPGEQTDLLVICNGGPLNSEQGAALSMIGARFWPRSNDGWDIKGFLEASKGPLFDYEMVLYLGESVFFWKPGWLKRLADTWRKYGVSMLGPFSSNVTRGHLQTTAFATSPKLLIEYPLPISDRHSRLEFEHGERAFWRLVNRKFPVKLVTWDGSYDPQQWRQPQNILWKGTQENLLFFNNHSQMYENSDPKRKSMWQASADRPFR